jgi:hypothetical protein
LDRTLVIVALWLGFALSHMGLSSGRLRPRLVGALGASLFQGLYSLVAFAFFVPLVWVYFAGKHAGPLLWSVPLGPGLRWTLYAAMGVAFVLVVAGFLQPSPAAIGSKTTQPGGVHLLTRHPVFMGTGLFGLLHLVPNGFASRLLAPGPPQACRGERNLPALPRADALPPLHGARHAARAARALAHRARSRHRAHGRAARLAPAALWRLRGRLGAPAGPGRAGPDSLRILSTLA